MYMISQQVEVQFKHEAHTKTQILTELVKNSLIISDYHEIQKIAQTLIESPEILKIEVKNKYNDIVAVYSDAEGNVKNTFHVKKIIQDKSKITSVENIGVISIVYSYSVMSRIFEKYYVLLIVATVTLFGILFLVLYFITKSIVLFFKELMNQFSFLESGSEALVVNSSLISEFSNTSDNLHQVSKRLIQLKKHEQETIKFKTISKVASQVAHDIRSPLAALNMVTHDLKQLPEDERIIIRSAVQRIQDIANDLASKKDQSFDKTQDIK
ncbi:MAG: hypothetical protein ABII18_10875, partial [bacterium]